MRTVEIVVNAEFRDPANPLALITFHGPAHDLEGNVPHGWTVTIIAHAPRAQPPAPPRPVFAFADIAEADDTSA